MFVKEGRVEGEVLYQLGVMRIGLGVKMKQRRAPMLGAPLLYEVKMIFEIQVVEKRISIIRIRIIRRRILNQWTSFFPFPCPQRVARLEEFDQLVFFGWWWRVALLQAGFETRGLIGYPLSPVFASASLSARSWKTANQICMFHIPY